MLVEIWELPLQPLTPSLPRPAKTFTYLQGGIVPVYERRGEEERERLKKQQQQHRERENESEMRKGVRDEKREKESVRGKT